MIAAFISSILFKIAHFVKSQLYSLTGFFAVLFGLLALFLLFVGLILLTIYIIKNRKAKRKENKNNKKQDTIKKPTPVAELSTNNLLYSVLGRFRENLTHRNHSSKELFLENYSDSSGNKYWRGWFDMPVLDVYRFADLLAIHKANEYVDDKREAFIAHGSPVEIMIPKYEAEQKKVLFALKNAAQGGVLFFRGDYSLLSGMKDNELSQGWKVEHWPLMKSLTEVKLNPREALEWFIATSTYTDLLPKSLRSWWERQANK